jgi:hypothetical protein
MAHGINKTIIDTDLQTHWAAEQCPIIDGIIFSDGRLRLMTVEWVRGQAGRLELSVSPGGWTSVAELASNSRLQWTGIIPLCNTEDLARKLRVIGGEGGLGSDGFVAVTSADNGAIVWIAFFNGSNPFEAIEIIGDWIVAKTNLQTVWRFPIGCPENVTLKS